MKQQDADDTLCPIARTAAIIADRWTILILRELRMGNDRFDGLQAQTGISSNLLNQRLKAMEDNGLIERRPYHEHPKRYAYCVTDKARELDGIMLTLRLWGMRHCGFDPDADLPKIGCATQTRDQGTGIGKVGVLVAGWADSVSAVTINRYCASGLSASARVSARTRPRRRCAWRRAKASAT